MLASRMALMKISTPPYRPLRTPPVRNDKALVDAAPAVVALDAVLGLVRGVVVAVRPRAPPLGAVGAEEARPAHALGPLPTNYLVFTLPLAIEALLENSLRDLKQIDTRFPRRR